MTCDDREPPPSTPMTGAERCIRAKVVMRGADVWDIVVRYETSLPLHVGCGPDPGVSSAPLVRGISGVEDMRSRWVS